MAGRLQLRGGRIWTGDPARPWADGLSIETGRVVRLDGSSSPGRGSVCDLGGGRTAVPGLIDSHVHLLQGGLSLNELDLSGVRSRAEFESAVTRAHAGLPRGRWLIGRGWSAERWTGGDPDRGWLAAAGDRPAVCYRMDLHAAVVNDAVLSMIDTASDLPGGRIARDPRTHAPTGLMVEAAAWKLVNPLIPRADPAARRAALRAALRRLASVGVTATGPMEYARDVAETYCALAGSDDFTARCRVTLLDRGWPLDLTVARGLERPPMLAVIGFKAFADGTLGSRTARMLEDYDDDPGNRGMLVELAAEGHLAAWAAAVARAGFSPSIHAIGDEAARLALDALGPVRAACASRGTRPRIEHAQQLHPDDIPRFAGLIASMQPLHKADDGRYARKRLGDARLARGFFAFRRLLDAGATLAFGSDWPVVSPDPLAGIRAAVTGRTLDGEVVAADQNLSVAEALAAYTRGAAAALGLDDAGVLRPGALADVTVLDRDPFDADWDADPPRVVATIVGGGVVYDSP